jgi:hypothetical protein
MAGGEFLKTASGDHEIIPIRTIVTTIRARRSNHEIHSRAFG